MIEGASQADFAILIISARKGEFEAGMFLTKKKFLNRFQDLKRAVKLVSTPCL